MALKQSAHAGRLIEPLTPRERDVLLLLAQHLRYQDIAGQLTMAVSSVKWFVQQIYGKLGVDNRRDAIQKAQELGLLDAPHQLDTAHPAGAGHPAGSALPAAPSAQPAHNLPRQLTRFIGREKEIAEVTELVRQNPLVTLTGSGGVGKTRLSQVVAGELISAFVDGVWLVELAPLTDARLVPQAVMAVFKLVEQPGKSPIEVLTDFLRQKQLLLILDNCEHLVDACAELVNALLQAAPMLKIMATSREILNVAGEMPYRVPSLGTPDPNHLPALENLPPFAAVELFLERARLVSPQFALTQANLAAVAQITRRLDGIPLAIELAAARLRLLSVEQVASRLDDAFHLLTGGSRTALPRQQTLQASIDWSYQLLSPMKRSLLRSLSVFSGGWTLEAAERVCDEDGSAEVPIEDSGTGEPIHAQDVLDLLAQLADRSLIQIMQSPAGDYRYAMLETIRQYAHNRLVEAGQAGPVRTRHLNYFLHLAERLETKIRGPQQIAVLNQLEEELDNLRSALEWAMQTDIEAGLRLASALKFFWHIRFHWNEAIAWLDQGLHAQKNRRGDQPDMRSAADQRGLIRAKALGALGFHLLMGYAPRPKTARQLLEEAVSLYQANPGADPCGLAWALLWLGSCDREEVERTQAQQRVEEALRLFRDCGEANGQAECLQLLGYWDTDIMRSEALHRQQLMLEQASGDTDGIANAHQWIGWAQLTYGNYAGACASFEASREQYQLVGNPDMVRYMGVSLAIALQFNGDTEHAALSLNEALARYQEYGSKASMGIPLHWLCLFAIARGQYHQAGSISDDAEQIARQTNDLYDLINVLCSRARLARLQGAYNAARAWAEEGLRVADEVGYPKYRLLPLVELGHLALRAGDLVEARAWMKAGLQVLLDAKDYWLVPYPLNGLADLAVREGKMEQAACLFGTRLLRGFAFFLSPLEQTWREQALAQVKSALGQAAFEQLLAEGAALTFQQTLILAARED